MYICGIGNCTHTTENAPAMSNHRKRKHVDLLIGCRFEQCCKKFLSLERERAHFYTVHRGLKCQLDSCFNCDHPYTEWKKLKVHLDKYHDAEGHSSYKTDLVSVQSEEKLIASPLEQSNLNEAVDKKVSSASSTPLCGGCPIQEEKKDILDKRELLLMAQSYFKDALAATGEEKVLLMASGNSVMQIANTMSEEINQSDETTVRTLIGKTIGKRKISDTSNKDGTGLLEDEFESSNNVCDTCGATFTTLKGLRRHHKDFHAGIKFDCNMCDKSFETSAKLYNHKQKEHLKKKRIAPYACSGCDRRFFVADDMRNHEARVHGKGSVLKFNCNYCTIQDQSYSSISNLNKHVKKDHPGCSTFTKADF